MQLVGSFIAASSALLLATACSSSPEVTPATEVAPRADLPRTLVADPQAPDDVSGPEATAPLPGGDVLAAPVALPVPRGTMSGQRLAARQLVAADGASEPAGWYDKTARVECAFERAADGWTRCLPARVSSIDERGYHLDPGCSEPLVVTADGCSPSPYASRREPADRCGGTPGTSIFEVGERAQPSTVYVQAGDSCKAVPVPPGVDLYLTSPVPPSRFVSARIVTP